MMSEELKVYILSNKEGDIICPQCKEKMFHRDYGRWLAKKLKSSKYIFRNIPKGLQFVIHKDCKRLVNESNIKGILKSIKFDGKNGVL